MELTNNQAYPLMGKALMKRTVFLLGILAIVFAMLFAFNTNASAADVKTPVYIQPGQVNGTWTNDNVYYIAGDIQIAAGKTLTIEEGTTVLFNNSAGLAVDGTLVADATGLNAIWFSANNDTSVGFWDGIVVNSTGVATFKNVEISFASESLFVNDGVAAIENVRINNTIVGIRVIESGARTNLTLTDIVIDSYWTYGIHVRNLDQAILFSLSDSELTGANGADGVYLEAGDDFNGTIEAVFEDVSVDGGWSAASAFAVLDIQMTVSGCTFTAQDDVALAADSLFGSVDMAIEDSVIDGSDAWASYWVYSITEVENEFEVIPRDVNSVNQSTSTAGVLVADLPFTFNFAGMEIDQVTMTNTYLSFLGGSIYPSSSAFLSVDGGSSFFGYAVYEDRAVFQWSQRMTYDSMRMNLYEVVMYATGEIQVNYDLMEGQEYGYFEFYTPAYNYYFDEILGSAFDLDYRSFVIGGESISAGTGVFAATLLGMVEMTVTNTTISSFDMGAIYALTDEGYVIFEMTGSTVSWINNDDFDAAINLWTEYGALDVVVEDNYFYQIYDAVFDMESYIAEADDEFVDIVGNEFVRCMAVGWVYTVVEVIEETEIEQSMTITRTFSGNTLTDSGSLGFGTDIYQFDNGSLALTIIEEFKDNTYETIQFMGDLPFFDWYWGWDFAMFESYTSYENWDALGNESYAKDLSITGNEFNGLIAVPYVTMGISYYYPDLFDIENWVDFSGEKFVADLFVNVTDNTAVFEQYQNADMLVELDSDYDLYEGDADIIETILMNGNSFTDAYLNVAAIDIETEANYRQNWDVVKTSTFEGVYEVNGNYFEGMQNGLILYVYREADNVVGDVAISDAISFNDNVLVGCGQAVDLYMQNDFGFNDYFPLSTMYDGENSVQDVEYNLDVEIMDNEIETVYDYSDYAIIDLYMYTYVYNYGNTLFTSPSLTGTSLISVAGNQIDVGVSYLDAILIEEEFYAEGRSANSNMTTDVAVTENEIRAVEELRRAPSYGFSEGIYVLIENYAYTNSNRDDLLDTPISVVIATIEISDNIVDGARWGIDVYNYADAEYGASQEYTTLDVLITNNEVYNSTEAGIYVYIDTNAYIGPYSIAQTNDVRTVTISQNVIDGIIFDAYGIWFETDYEISGGTGLLADGEEWFPMVGETTFVIENNEISNVYGGIYGDAYSDLGVDVKSYILDNNLVSLDYYGIEFYDGYVEIVGNLMTEGWGYGIYIEYATGLISENEISLFDYSGVYGYDLWDMVISDNVITQCGLDEYYGMEFDYLYNVTVSGNTITNNGYGLDVYSAEDCAFIDNVVDMNSYGGAYFEYIDYSVIEGNSFSLNGGTGVYFYYGWDFVFGNNTVSKNLGYGLYLYISDYRGYLYNNEFSYNEDTGLYTSSYDDYGLTAEPYIVHADEWFGLIWIVDAEASVVMNSVQFDGEIEVVEGSVLKIESVEYFYLDESYVDGTPSLLVYGTLTVLNSYVYSYNDFEFEIYGTVDAELSTFEGMKMVYIAEGSQAAFRQCEFGGADLETIFVDNSSPLFSMCTMIGNMDRAVVWIQGADANPTITSGIILNGLQGIYAKDTSLGNVFDNIFIMNGMAGIYGEGVTGKIHDNVFMLNGVGILLKGSNVSIEDNEIGWTMYIDALAEYAPLLELLGHHFIAIMTAVEDMPDIPLPFGMDRSSPMTSMLGMLTQVGVYAEDSDLVMSGNTYGMLYQCVYLNGGSLSFSDKIETRTLEVPYFLGLNTSSLSIPVQNVNGLYAVNADVVVDGAEISVVDDAIVLEACTASITNSVLDAGDFDIFAMAGSEVSVSSTVMESVKSEDSNSITVYYLLEVTALDADGNPVADRTVKVYDADGVEIARGKTDANGKFTTSVEAYKVTDAGKGAAETYTVKVDFKNGDVSADAAATDAITSVTITAEKDNTAMYVGVAVVALAVLLIAVALLMRAKKK